MKKIITAIVFCGTCLSGFNANAQAPDWAWVKSNGGGLAEDAKGIAADRNGNVFVTGNYYSSSIAFGSSVLSNAGNNDVFLVKYDAAGNIQWAAGAGGPGYDFGKAVATDAAGNVYMAGNFQSSSITFGSTTLTSAGAEDIFLVKYNAAGAVQWAVRAGSGTSDQAFGVTADSAGNVYITGSYNGTVAFGSTLLTSAGGNDIFIAKYNTAGVGQWAISAGGSSGDAGAAICLDAAGNILLTGTFYSAVCTFGTLIVNNISSANYEVFTAKYDASGTALWAKGFGGTSSESSYSITTDHNNDVYVSGYFSSATVLFGSAVLTNAGATDIFLIKYNAAGTEQWAQGMGGTGSESAYGVVTDEQDNVYLSGDFGSAPVSIAGATLNTTGTSRDIYIAKYSAAGIGQWARSAAGSAQDYCFGLAIDRAGNVFMAGSTGSTSCTFGSLSISPIASYDIYVAKISSLTAPEICMVTVDSLSNYNVIYWDRAANLGVDSFIVYRETAINVYKKVGTVPADSSGTLIDTVRTLYFPNTGDPNQGTYKYKLRSISVLGDTSAMGPWHKSIFVNQTGGVFTFNDYSIEGVVVPVPELVQYLLLRDDNSTGVWNVLSANTSSPMNDPNYLTYPNASWRIETDWTISCDPDRATVNTARSNIKHPNLSTGIGLQIIRELEIYPNPAKGNVTVKFEQQSSATAIKIINALGQIVSLRSVAAGATSTQINTADLAKGIYTISIETGTAKVFKKLVIN